SDLRHHPDQRAPEQSAHLDHVVFALEYSVTQIVALSSREPPSLRRRPGQLAPYDLMRSNRPMSGSPSPAHGSQDLPAITPAPAALLRVPRATYRLQLGPPLTFDDAAGLGAHLAPA